MKKIMSKKNQSCELIYLESLNRLIAQNHFSYLEKNSSILFISTQRFYEYYYEKITRDLKETITYHWYICPNNDGINYTKSFQRILQYIEEMKIPENTVILAAGNDKIFHLAGQIKNNSPFISNFTYVPTTLKGLMTSLSGISYLLNDKLTISMEQKSLPETIVYDTMLNELEDNQTWSEDFFELIKFSLMLDNELFKTIVPYISKEKDVLWSPFLDAIIEMIEEAEIETNFYLTNLSKSFYQLHESHYLTGEEKENISFLIFLLWSLKKNSLSFDFEAFVHWLVKYGGFHLELPIQMNTYDLAECMVKEMNRLTQMIIIQDIGKVSLSEIPTLEEMYHVVESYRTIKSKSRD